MVTSQTQQNAQWEGTTQEADSKGKITEFLWRMQKQNRSKLTIDGYRWALYKIVEKGADLEDTESVKDTLARHKFGDQTKRAIIIAYTTFLKMNGKQWQKPTINITRKLPFIPLEREIDDLIAGSGKKTSSFLQLLKETGMRAGEGIRIKWTDTDTQRNTITLNEQGNPKNLQSKPKTVKHARKTAEKLSKNLQLHLYLAQNKSSLLQETHSKKPKQPTTAKNNLSHTTPLESNNGIPSNQRYTSRQRTTRTQKTRHHNHVHPNR